MSFKGFAKIFQRFRKAVLKGFLKPSKHFKKLFKAFQRLFQTIERS